MTAISQQSWLGNSGRHGARHDMRPGIMHVAGCALAFGAVLAGGIYLMNAAGWNGVAHERAARDATQARVAAAERVLADAAHGNAPAAVSADDGRERASGWPVLMLELAELAASSGLRVVSLEPQSAQDGGNATASDARRTVLIMAHGGFPALQRMIGGLAALPVLVVPTAMRVERDASASRVQLSLDVFPALPGGGAVSDDMPTAHASIAADPFSGGAEPETGDASVSRLAGVMWDARAGLALFDDRAGTITTAAAGETVGGMRVMRIESDGVMFATASGPRRIAMDDGGGQW